MGCGNIGSVISKDLAENLPSAKIVMADAVESRAKAAASEIGRGNVSWAEVDASNRGELVKTLRMSDLAVGALPGFMGFLTCKAAVSAGVDIIDVSYMPEDVMRLSKAAVKAGTCIVPDCGFSPGLSNILVGHAVSQLDTVDSVHILNGGLPEKPVPPLGYVITWSVKDLIDMYSRKPVIVKNGKVRVVEAMSGLEEMTFTGVGKLEAFYTDGLRTLLCTVKVEGDMWEKTLRYSGHVEKIKLLKGLGFFDDKQVNVDGSLIAPRELTAQLLQSKLKRPDVRDIVAMLIETSGTKNKKKVTYSYRMLERYDKTRKTTAMARATAYTASVTAQLVSRKTVDEKGVVPPEKLGMNNGFYTKFMKEIQKRGIIIKEERVKATISQAAK